MSSLVSIFSRRLRLQVNEARLTQYRRKARSYQCFLQTPQFSTTIKMSSIGGATIGAGLYAAVSNPAQIGATPEDAADKRHHLKNGKGFTNPWDSYVDATPWQLLTGLGW